MDELTANTSHQRLAPVVGALLRLLHSLDLERLCTPFAFGDLALETWFPTTLSLWNVNEVAPFCELFLRMYQGFEEVLGELERPKRLFRGGSSLGFVFCSNARVVN